MKDGLGRRLLLGCEAIDRLEDQYFGADGQGKRQTPDHIQGRLTDAPPLFPVRPER